MRLHSKIITNLKLKNLSRIIVWIAVGFLLFILITTAVLLNMQYTRVGLHGISRWNCERVNGRIVNTLTLDGATCREGETNFGGEIAGLRCPCICCVPEREQ